MRISDWSSDVCSSDLSPSSSTSRRTPDDLALRLLGALADPHLDGGGTQVEVLAQAALEVPQVGGRHLAVREEREGGRVGGGLRGVERSEEHTSELQSLMRISYAVFCLK